jgi:hypothetical protein
VIAGSEREAPVISGGRRRGRGDAVLAAEREAPVTSGVGRVVAEVAQ